MQNVSCKSWVCAIKWKALCSVITVKKTLRVSQSQHFTCRFAALPPRIITLSLTNLTLQAMQQAGVTDPGKCLFVDDSFSNIEGAKRVGWIRCVHFREVGHELLHAKRIAGVSEKPISGDVIPVVTDLQQLRDVWPDIFV